MQITGWFAPLLFAYPEDRFSRSKAHLHLCKAFKCHCQMNKNLFPNRRVYMQFEHRSLTCLNDFTQENFVALNDRIADCFVYENVC